MNNEFDKAADALADAAKASENVAQASMDHAAKFDPPGRAREYVQTTAEIAKGRTADMQASAGRVSHALEGRMMEALGEVAKVTRDWQRAVFNDVEGFWAHVGKLASANSLNEALDTQSAFLRERAETMTARVRAAGEYFGNLMNQSVQAVQGNLSPAQPFGRKAA